ncbi:hypothetical protein ACLOJK_030429 [Asimina triloba]
MTHLDTFTMASNLAPQPLPVTNKRTAPTEPSPKAQSESFESVRAKLRESLAASLALVSQPQNKHISEEKSNQNEDKSTPIQAHVANEQAKPTLVSADSSSFHVREKTSETLVTSACEPNQNHNSTGLSTSNNNWINGNTYSGQEFQPKHVSLEDEVMFNNNFIVRDELLQGHGLCWASDLEIGGEMMESREPKRPKMTSDISTELQIEQVAPQPQALANKIEAELFKLFGGVNKKYKEKGRSLLFNLKDRNNPELREQVMSGKIPPERLCSMSAEELASKELSQWRIAKAEELAQMVVLPDSEVDIRRLVKKTHKGEFQVEVEWDDGGSEEVALGASLIGQLPSRANGSGSQVPSKHTEINAQIAPKSNETGASGGVAAPEKPLGSGDQGSPSNVITISHDAADFMQGFMEDELKDAEFLPPIVSLDEFMESLNSEPPFENLQQETGQDNSVSVETKSEGSGSKSDSLKDGSTDPGDAISDKPDQVDLKPTETANDLEHTKNKDTGTDSDTKDSKDTKTAGNLKDGKYVRSSSGLKSSDIQRQSETSQSSGGNKLEHVWEGILQLNVSVMATVVGIFKSGEKTSGKDWPTFLEIKGRVRLDAFEKFLQELPLSRSRAIMVVHFCWKEGSPESGRLHLSEVADSYVADERVGFAEPAPAVELYLCPPHLKMVEILGRHLPKDHTNVLNTIDNGLIGIVVWRKPHVTASISPRMPSYQRQNSKKHHFPSERQDKDGNPKQTHPPIPPGLPPSNPNPPSDDDDDMDDIPPGFGPGAGRDDDDLPEFDFVKTTKPHGSRSPQGAGTGQIRPSARPVPQQMQQMRELVHKYGQGKLVPQAVSGHAIQGLQIETQPWNDDDDIPEWRPEQDSQQLPPPPVAMHGLQQQAGPAAAPAHLLIQQELARPQRPSSLPSLPPQMGQGVAATRPPSWQGSHRRDSRGSQDVGVQGSGLMQACNFGGQPVDGQFYKTKPGFRAGPNGMDRRPDLPRSR